MKELNLEVVKTTLADMGIPYSEDGLPENLVRLVKQYGYDPAPLLVDLTEVDTVDAEIGLIVRNANLEVDDGVYIFTVLHSGKAGFIVVQPCTISRAPLIRKLSGDLTSAITAVELPPLQPFDMIEIVGQLLVGTFLKTIMESYNVPKEYEQPFLRLYMPKFLANVGMYYVGLVNEDGSPKVHEQTANMEPMIVCQSLLMKGELGTDEKDKKESEAEKEA